jgi:hypothetical protein
MPMDEDDAAREQRAPRHADAQPLAGEKRRRLRRQPFDDQVVELELAVPQPDAEPADAHRPLDEARSLTFRLRLECRAEIDGHGGHDHHGHDDRERGDHPAHDDARPP